MKSNTPEVKTKGGEGGTHSPPTPFEHHIYSSQTEDLSPLKSTTLFSPVRCSIIGVHLSLLMRPFLLSVHGSGHWIS
jgi:hypothetical protein